MFFAFFEKSVSLYKICFRERYNVVRSQIYDGSVAVSKPETSKLIVWNFRQLFKTILCSDAGKAGVGKEATSASKMSLEEAHKILGTAHNAPVEEILKVNLDLRSFERLDSSGL